MAYRNFLSSKVEELKSVNPEMAAKDRLQDGFWVVAVEFETAKFALHAASFEAGSDKTHDIS